MKSERECNEAGEQSRSDFFSHGFLSVILFVDINFKNLFRKDVFPN